MKRPGRLWTSLVALVVGIGAVIGAFVFSSTQVGQGFTLGLGAFIVFFASMSLLARDPVPGHWGVLVAGLTLAVVPWLGAGFVPDRGAAWTAGVAGVLALICGGIGWVTGDPPTKLGVNEYGSREVRPGVIAKWLSGSALALGAVAVVLAATFVRTSSAATVVIAGAGVLIAVTALWSLLAADPTRDYFKLSVVGLALFMAPWVVGFTAGVGAWTAWSLGFAATALGVAGYLRGEYLDAATVVRDDARTRYRERVHAAAR
ncbi:hypothetical protein H7I41_18320 [Mycobacterium manitobense]|uniref:SPW repeat-containing protein n=1 Tax=[Mycobacterium] manitobense TaxID=190147 RepID=A0A9X3BVJ3_9MYCO|nr:hypothetical protein [[Mycobacterium] manitobense]MCV7171873.1 hypothetical protein [[Mycobacterium] manitobense]